MQGSCETRQQKLASSSNSTSSNNVSDQDNKNTKEKECGKLVTYPIMQVWKLYKYKYTYKFVQHKATFLNSFKSRNTIFFTVWWKIPLYTLLLIPQRILKTHLSLEKIRQIATPEGINIVI